MGLMNVQGMVQGEVEGIIPGGRGDVGNEKRGGEGRVPLTFWTFINKLYRLRLFT
jgi:hypothetical protein